MRYAFVVLMLAGCEQSHYQIAAVGPAVWKLDTRSGEIKYCYWSGNPLEDGKLVCIPIK